MLGRLWELCAQECPPERPCPPPAVCAATVAALPRQAGRRAGAGRLLGAGRRFLAAHLEHLAAGLPRISATELAGRAAQCNTCVNRDTERNRCKLCLCGLEGRIFNKLRLPLESCPQKPPRWGPIEPRGWRRWLLALIRPLSRWLKGPA